MNNQPLLKRLTIELEIRPIDELNITKTTQHVWATSISPGIFMPTGSWRLVSFVLDDQGNVKWNDNNGAGERSGRHPFTHYTILPTISAS